MDMGFDRIRCKSFSNSGMITLLPDKLQAAQNLTVCSTPGAGRLAFGFISTYICCVEFALDCTAAFQYPGQWDTSPQREAFHLEG